MCLKALQIMQKKLSKIPRICIYMRHKLQFKGLSKNICLINRNKNGNFCNANYYTTFSFQIMQDAWRYVTGVHLEEK